MAWRLDRITEAISAAALDSSRRSQATDVIAASTDSFGANIFPVQGRLPTITYSASLTEAHKRYLAGGWIERDESCRGAPTLLRPGIATEFSFTTPDAMAKDPLPRVGCDIGAADRGSAA